MKNKKISDPLDKPIMDRKQLDLEKSEIPGGPISSFTLFMKVGIIVLSIIAIIGFGIQIIPGSIAVSTLNSKRDLPIYCVDTQENKVSLSFDLAFGNDDIKEILDILNDHDIKATFFVTGSWVEDYPNDLKEIVKAGHDLGNHSESHQQMTLMTKDEAIDEILTLHDKVMGLTGIEMTLFRAPYGDYNRTLIKAAKECGYDTIQWDIDSMDWKDYGIDGILNETVANDDLGSGSIILLHNGTKYTVDALDEIIVGIKDLGYELVPVSELIYTGEYTVDQTGRQFEK